MLLRDVRLGLVLNGGVSLAVWIGGVTHEIDCLRRAFDASDAEIANESTTGLSTTGLYRRLLSLLRERVLVDVIAGASAGGINGALLAAAVYAETPLPRLRDVWFSVGDFQQLLRSPGVREPPSILRGDEYVLPQLEQRFDEILGVAGSGPPEPVYLYVTATDFYGAPRVFADSSRRRFQEREHRRVFQFQHPAPGQAGAEELEAVAAEQEAAAGGEPSTRGEMPLVGGFDRADAAKLLARAARSSSSFPVAFEPHGLRFEDDEVTTWLIDGGVLDNQPFNPVLNRIATIAGGDRPVKRVVGYVVPYVTEPDPLARAAEDEPKDSAGDGAVKQPTAKDTADAAGRLPRDLPKLSSLARIVRELGEARRAARARERLNELSDPQLKSAAAALFGAYRETRYAECLETFAHWALPGFRPGAGEIGQVETLDPRQALEAPITFERLGPAPTGLRWLPDDHVWEAGKEWRWGLSPSERIAAEALVRLRALLHKSPAEAQLKQAKEYASELVAEIRAKKFLACAAFQNDTNESESHEERADSAYEQVVGDYLKTSFTQLERYLAAIGDAPRLQRLINAEVVDNAFGVVRSAVPPVFEFLHMSAGIRNSLGHSAASPDGKLAGMKLGHFAGFLKRSWRANDWLWGRLDGVEYLVAAAFDLGHLQTVAAHGDGGAALRQNLSEFAFPDAHRDVLTDPWRRTLHYARSRQDFGVDVSRAVADVLDEVKNVDPRNEFRSLLLSAADDRHGREVRAAVFDCCRAALAARIQLEILADELPAVLRAIKRDLALGASHSSAGADWADRGAGQNARERVERFRSLELGSEESPGAEASSKLGMDVSSTGLAVAAAAFSGSRGGLPAAIRAPLASVRGLTLVFNTITRLLVRTPVLGIAAMTAAAVALVWGLVAPNTLLGAALPGLAALVLGGAAVLIAMATSPLESRCRSWRQGLGLLAIVTIPVLLITLLLGLPFGLHDPPELGGANRWLVRQIGSTWVDLGASFLVAAVVAAVTRLTLGWKWRRLRLVDLWIYRICFLIAGALIATGATVEHVHDQGSKQNQSGWSHVADNWRGTMLFLILFGAISLVPVVAELAAVGRRLVSLPLRRGRTRDSGS